MSKNISSISKEISLIEYENNNIIKLCYAQCEIWIELVDGNYSERENFYIPWKIHNAKIFWPLFYNYIKLTREC